MRIRGLLTLGFVTALAVAATAAAEPPPEAPAQALAREETGLSLTDAFNAVTGRDARLTSKLVAYAVKRTPQPLERELAEELRQEREDCDREYKLQAEHQSCYDSLVGLKQSLDWVHAASAPAADSRQKLRLAARIYQQHLRRELLERKRALASGSGKGSREAPGTRRLVFAVTESIASLAEIDPSNRAAAAEVEREAQRMLQTLDQPRSEARR